MTKNGRATLWVLLAIALTLLAIVARTSGVFGASFEITTWDKSKLKFAEGGSWENGYLETGRLSLACHIPVNFAPFVEGLTYLPRAGLFGGTYFYGILGSMDNGQTWDLIGEDLFGDAYITSFAKLNGNLYCVVVRNPLMPQAMYTEIWRSIDGGYTWQCAISQVFEGAAICAEYNGQLFISLTTGEIHIFDGDQWQQTDFEGEGAGAFYEIRSELYCILHDDAEHLSRIYEYDASTKGWDQLPPLFGRVRAIFERGQEIIIAYEDCIVKADSLNYSPSHQIIFCLTEDMITTAVNLGDMIYFASSDKCLYYIDESENPVKVTDFSFLFQEVSSLVPVNDDLFLTGTAEFHWIRRTEPPYAALQVARVSPHKVVGCYFYTHCMDTKDVNPTYNSIEWESVGQVKVALGTGDEPATITDPWLPVDEVAVQNGADLTKIDNLEHRRYIRCHIACEDTLAKFYHIKIIYNQNGVYEGPHGPAYGPVEYLRNYPNPFNQTTRFVYDLAQAAFVKLSICDIVGRELVTVVEGKQSEGQHVVGWNTQKMASGVYMARLKIEGQKPRSTRVTLLR